MAGHECSSVQIPDALATALTTTGGLDNVEAVQATQTYLNQVDPKDIIAKWNMSDQGSSR